MTSVSDPNERLRRFEISSAPLGPRRASRLVVSTNPATSSSSTAANPDSTTGALDENRPSASAVRTQFGTYALTSTLSLSIDVTPCSALMRFQRPVNRRLAVYNNFRFRKVTRFHLIAFSRRPQPWSYSKSDSVGASLCHPKMSATNAAFASAQITADMGQSSNVMDRLLPPRG